MYLGKWLSNNIFHIEYYQHQVFDFPVIVRKNTDVISLSYKLVNGINLIKNNVLNEINFKRIQKSRG